MKLGRLSLSMSRHVGYVASAMATGPSGRIVVDVDPEFKRQLYSALAAEGSTLKDWFIRTGRNFCAATRQPSLHRVAEDSGTCERNDDE